ncbi:Long-chain-fatty-acid--CoA ligase [Saccharolobus shibatae B12]|uniref:Long-chain-fatty-acid--CoA ligase n=1 Tax=Saccharolobus shibatae (strain ATCC 51178 / DSM 5389 / JCM 8931 / NBRC 15437 / B12) TaxID=523848 RepID=A0A8F5GU28_SACSH|nr:class I adenylate-forming enzyme family protein [Saccharolobus shibatae]QXJ29416.1 Long-chain-fatty-acid--CoA ligase [Saccharolobus shibatae B12]
MSLATLLYEKGKSSRTFLIGEKILTYHETIEEISSIASNFSPGDTVVHLMYNSIPSILAYLAAFWAGSKVVALDPLTSAEDLKFTLEDAKPEAVITDNDIYNREKNVLKDYKVITQLQMKEKIREPYEYKDNEVGLVYYYAGIAGKTMQVLHSPRRVIKNVEESYNISQIQEVRSILTVPLTHVLGNSVLGITIKFGGAIYIMKKFDIKELVNAIQTYKINYLSTVPMIYDSLLSENADLSSLELCISSAAPLLPNTLKSFKEKYGKDILQAYGCTECLGVTHQPKEYAGILTIGKPLPSVEIKIVKDDGKEAKIGEVGELWIKSPWTMLGYKDENETRKVFEGDWLKTGDLVTMDEKGLLYFRGVKKRMLKYKGYPIFPRDLEDILKTHEMVIDAKVLGEDEGNLGQKPVAYVIVKDRRSGLEEELLNLVNSKVAFYKRLKKVYIVDKLP